MENFIGLLFAIPLSMVVYAGVLFWNAWFITLIWPWFINYPTPGVAILAGILGLYQIVKGPVKVKKKEDEDWKQDLKQLAATVFLAPYTYVVCYFIKIWFL